VFQLIIFKFWIRWGPERGVRVGRVASVGELRHAPMFALCAGVCLFFCGGN